MAWPLIAMGAGMGMQALGGYMQARDQNKKIKNALSDYAYSPYSGARPPNIDYDGKQYLRPTQDMLQKIIMERSQGIGVGYDPARRAAQEALIKSTLGKQQEDDIRYAKGSVAASGLGGNLRAQEALTGRVNRDYGRTLGEELGKISIEDLTRANEERDINTSRLQDLNTFNFGQENTVADFDLNKWKAEESAKQGRTGAGLEAAGMYRDPWSMALQSSGSSLASLGMGNLGGGGTGNTLPSSSYQVQGQGLAPSYPSSVSQALAQYYQNRSNRRLTS